MCEPSELPRCGKCGSPLNGGGPEGLCAGCLLESAFGGSADIPSVGFEPAPLLAFGDYELVEEIARGGMGVVYRARQVSLNRTVAVKMMLGGHLADQGEIQRFRAEAETAARLQHANIVAIHEVGEHAGQPFFSMDLVAGRSLAQVLRDGPLSSRQAATYLKTIAEAVDYAHSRGVLHRDLKPSNILIDETDQPRITDFGLAKRLDDSGCCAPHSPLTMSGQVLGSPSFIPPEQAAGRTAELSPASDVYSLGAILYQCLAGRPPFVAETITATLRMVAEHEAVSPRLLNASVPRDLETICLKCLEKESQRRYPTARELAEDLGRFLQGEPIRARPTRLPEKTWRWCRRKPATAAALFLVVLVAVGSPVAAYHINRERLHAQASQSKAEATVKFLVKMLEGAGPSQARGRDATLLKEILDEAATTVGSALTNQPEVEADVRLIIGKTYLDLGQNTNALTITQDALRLYRKALGPKHIKVAGVLNNLGAIWSEIGDLEKASTCDREALEMKKVLLGPEDPDLATTMSNLGFRLWNRGDLAEAEPLLRDALRIRLKKLKPDHPDLAMSQNNLAMVLWSRGEFKEAESYFRQALASFRKIYPGDHPKVAVMLNNVATVLRDLGQLDDAEAMKRDALAMRQRVLGPKNGYTAYANNELAVVLQYQGKLAEAEPLHREALKGLQESLGTNHTFYAEAVSGLGMLLSRKGDVAGGETLQRDALAIAERALGKGNPGTAEPLEQLALMLGVRGDLTQAASLLSNVVAIATKSVGRTHPDLIPSLWHLAWVLKQQGDVRAAELLKREAMSNSLQGGAYGLRALTQANYELADLLQAQNRFAEAEAVLLELSACLERPPGAGQVFEHPLHQRLAHFYEAWDRIAPNTGKAKRAAESKHRLEVMEQGAARTP